MRARRDPSTRADLGLTIDLYQPFRNFEAVPADQLARNLRRAERKLDVMQQLGTDTMLVCSNVSGPAVDDDALAAEQLHELGRRAGERGMRIAYEALAWGRHVDDYRHAWRIVAAANSPHVGVCLDSFHVLSRGHDPAAIRDIPGDKIFFLQLADAPQLGMDVLQWSRHYRCFPGQGGFDLAAFLGHVLAAGYRGPLSLEVFNDVFRHSDPERTAVDALRSLLALEESVQARAGQDPALGEELRELELYAPPAPVEPSGYAFVEVAVDEESGPALKRVLATLGFTGRGEHVSKPVQLWEQARARVLLNRHDQQLTDRRDGDDVFTAAATMRAYGAELLTIPDNYYADLAARTDLDPALLERMREFGVLYDRSEDGEFFHFYTPVYGRRLFFEVVQRVGSYRGYGAVNAQVRISAQRAASARAGTPVSSSS